MTDYDYLIAHVDALFRQDTEGRMTAINVVDRNEAPRFYLGRAAGHNISRYRNDLPEPVIAELEAILSDEPVSNSPPELPVTYQRLFEALDRAAPVARVWSGPAWRFPDEIPAPPDIEVRRVTPEMEIGGDRFLWIVDELEHWQPAFVVLENDRIVSLCHSSRNTPDAAEAGVETLEGYRQRGYAGAVTTAWARSVRDQGREPLYSTSWDNQASRALAQRLGLALFGVDLHFD